MGSWIGRRGWPKDSVAGDRNACRAIRHDREAEGSIVRNEKIRKTIVCYCKSGIVAFLNFDGNSMYLRTFIIANNNCRRRERLRELYIYPFDNSVKSIICD